MITYNTLIANTAAWISPWIDDTVIGEQITMPSPDTPFYTILHENKFYKDATYLEDLQKSFSSDSLPTPVYTWNTETRSTRIAKRIWSTILFPLFLRETISRIIICTFNLFISSCCYIFNINKTEQVDRDNFVNRIIASGWVCKRITFQVDGMLIDACIAGREQTLHNRRWMLVSSIESYATTASTTWQHIGSALDVNCLFFDQDDNLHRVKENKLKAYCAALRFLEHANGIAAKEIICYGYCCGSAIQNESLLSHELQKNISYVFIQNQSFTRISEVFAHRASRWAQIVQRFLQLIDEDYGNPAFSIQSTYPEIIIQAMEKEAVINFNPPSPDAVLDSLVIPKNASLAKAVLTSSKPLSNKRFIARGTSHQEFAWTDETETAYNYSHLLQALDQFMQRSPWKEYPRQIKHPKLLS